MQSITLKNIPPGLYESLKEMAKCHRRSLSDEILHCLEQYTRFNPTPVQHTIEKARQLRAGIAHRFSEAEIRDAINEGRK